MKVSNNKIGSTSAKIDAGKTGKAGAAGGIKSDIKSSSVGARALGEGANVNVSDRAQQMQKARDIASESSVDEAKVARLQKMIDEGKYSVDADKIADRLVDEHMLIPD